MSTPIAAELTRSQAAIDVLRERLRQQEGEGFDAAHDDEHNPFELAAAGAAYAWAASLSDYDRKILIEEPHSFLAFLRRHIWPSRWDRRWWKPKTRRADLVRAGALILAQIEKLDRAEARQAGGR